MSRPSTVSQRMRALSKRALQPDGSRRHRMPGPARLVGEVVEGPAAAQLRAEAQEIVRNGMYVTLAIGPAKAQRLALYDPLRDRLALIDTEAFAAYGQALFDEADLTAARLAMTHEEDYAAQNITRSVQPRHTRRGEA